jgi:serine protease Do
MPFADAVEQAKRSVVRIEATRAGGSGVMITPHAALTNAHVVEGNAAVTVVNHGGTVATGQVTCRYRDLDLAVIRVREVVWPPVKLGDPASLREGDEVVALGHPLGLPLTVTKGIISARARAYRGNIYIQTDAAISPGNSGGPLLDRRGEVVALTTFIAAGGHSLNFAIPIDRAVAAVRDALEDSKDPSLTCPACERPVPIDEVYCGTCGFRIGEMFAGSHAVAGHEMEALLVSYHYSACGACGSIANGGTYCQSCGLRLKRSA